MQTGCVTKLRNQFGLQKCSWGFFEFYFGGSLLFYDYVKIYVRGGDGGNGMVTFRREKYVPMGGPSGGDGGDGANVVFVADESLTTLVDFKYRQHYKAERGENGMRKNMHGRNGQDLLVKVPVGTIVRDDATGELLADIVDRDQTFVVAHGGRGGRGNARFKSAKNCAPEIAENGEPGEERWLRLELKLLADAALVGLPNADYPFTTLHPNLGVVNLEPGMSFVLADIPGLIEGAANGVGLGHRFLRHVERSRLLIHLVDMSGLGELEPWEEFDVIDKELELYREDLASRRRIVVANKMDMPDAPAKLAEFKKHIGKDRNGEDYQIFEISALTGSGLNDLMYKIYEILQDTPMPEPAKQDEGKITVVEDKPEFEIEHVEDGLWRVIGEKLEKLVIMTNWEHDDSLRRLQNILTKIGLDAALREAGAVDGDLVQIADKEFDYAE
jgi:GTP-binding protein